MSETLHGDGINDDAPAISAALAGGPITILADGCSHDGQTLTLSGGDFALLTPIIAADGSAMRAASADDMPTLIVRTKTIFQKHSDAKIELGNLNFLLDCEEGARIDFVKYTGFRSNYSQITRVYSQITREDIERFADETDAPAREQP